MPKTFISIVLVFTLFITTNAFAGVVIIVNKNNPVVNISTSQLKNMYNGDLKLWDSGKKVLPVVLKDSNPTAIKFVSSILGIDMETWRRYWAQKLFSGTATPPHQEKDESSLVSYVSEESGAIGYVMKESTNNSVKVISVDGKSEF